MSIKVFHDFAGDDEQSKKESDVWQSLPNVFELHESQNGFV